MQNGIKAVVVALIMTSCGEAPRPAPEAAAPPAEDLPAPVSAPASDDAGRADSVQAALAELVQGPSEAERAAGRQSWFSRATAGTVRSVRVDSAGHAVVDFSDLRPLIPNASSSAGSTALLAELNAVVFRFPHIKSVEYRIEGSCDTFGEWLQYGCQTMQREQ